MKGKISGLFLASFLFNTKPNLITEAEISPFFSFLLKGAQSRYFELFWPRTKLPLS